MQSQSLHGLYNYFCPNCGGINSDTRNIGKFPCEKCLPKYQENETQKEIADDLKKSKKLENYLQIIEIQKNFDDFSKIFKKSLGSEPLSIQRAWFKRIVQGKSFTALAPTGVGKTTFGMMTAIYLAREEYKKSLIIVPNSTLLNNIYNKLMDFNETLKGKLKVLYFSSKFTPKKKIEFEKSLANQDYDILILTNQFLSRKADKLLVDYHFDFVFADDTDSLLKTSKNIDRILKFIGFSQEDLALAFDYIKSSFKYSRNSQDDAFVEGHKELKNNVQNIKNTKKIGNLVISTATGRGRGMRPKLFKALLSFDIGGKVEGGGKILDLIDENDSQENLVKWIKKLGGGGLIFVPISKGMTEAEKLLEYLKEQKIKAGLASSGNANKMIEALRAGEIDVLIGITTHYGLLVRGLDLPETVRYAIFFGVPNFKFSINMENQPNSFQLIRILGAMSYILEDDEKQRVEKQLRTLKKNSFNPKVVEHSYKIAKEYFVKPEMIEALKKSEQVVFKEENGNRFMLIPDVPTYIQASGRTSRLFLDGFTQGISLILESDSRMAGFLAKRLSWLEDRAILPVKQSKIKEVIEVVNQDREKVKDFKSQKKKKARKDDSLTVLMIVESPTKAGIISNLLGKPGIRYFKGFSAYEISFEHLNLIIVSTMGHIYDITTEPSYGFHGVDVSNKQYLGKYTTIKSCKSCKRQFTYPETECPICKSTDLYNKRDIVEDLKDLAKEVDIVFISTDPDTEGEKIGWDIASLLSPYVKDIKRVTYHEVTKRGVIEAFKHVGVLNPALIEAQLVRRIQDRWVGFEFSGILKEEFKELNVSAGRVQTPVLGQIIERKKENEATQAKFYSIKTEEINLEVPRAQSGDMKKTDSLTVFSTQDVIEKLSPLPPFTTDSLLIEANRRFGFGADQTMNLAQALFENGLITYHRTDSNFISLFGQNVARDFVSKNYGIQYLQNRSWGEEGTHEAIRVTKGIDVKELREMILQGDLMTATNLTSSHFTLYDFIFKRFMASQMKEIQVKKQKAVIQAGKAKHEIIRNVEVVDEGFNKVSPVYLYPVLKAKKKIPIVEIKSVTRADKKLFTQADVIELMKEKGLGRPSTYSQILSTLISRGYIMEVQHKRLIPTKKGLSVYDFLFGKFQNIFSENRTKDLEKIMKEVETGKTDYHDVLDMIYNEIKTAVK